MTTSTNTTHRAIASLNLPLKVPALITYAMSIVAAMTNNPHFVTPTPPLANVTTAITTLGSAESATLTRTKGAVPVRNAAKGSLVLLLLQLRGYVQNTADADVENGAAIIASAGMAIRKTPVRGPRIFAVEAGPTTGSAKLTAGAAARRASYEWEYSPDGGHTWMLATPTLQAKTVITGLPVGTTVQFRYRGVTKTGVVDWSAPISLLVK
jgi:hypothetical protein